MLHFAAGPSLNVNRAEGPLVTLLECDSNELLGSGWRSVVQECDRDATDEIEADVFAGRAGTYIVRATAKMGDKFIVCVRTIVEPVTGTTRGSSTLQGHALNRKHFPITTAVLKRGIR